MSGRAPRVIRVFPRQTKATPVDAMVRFGPPGMFDEADEIHVSVTFTWDLPRAEQLAHQWEHIAPVKIGGPATGIAGGDFTPGMYLKPGYVITSRGCPNRCWFCSVWRREGTIRELPVTEGYIVADDNLLACSEEHIREVFAMLKRQSEKSQFSGGLEAAILKPWHVDLLADLKPARMYFAYDSPDDLEPLREAGRMLDEAGLRNHNLCCYVLVGYPHDTFDGAEQRLRDVVDAGFFPFAMLYRDHRGNRTTEWIRFQRQWAQPYLVGQKMTAKEWVKG